MAQRRAKASTAERHLQLEGEVVDLWFRMHSELEAHFTHLAEQHGLSPMQAKVLVQIQADGSATMRALATQLRYDSSNLTGVVDRLEATGALRRASDLRDRRVRRVELTDAGRQLRTEFWTRLTTRSGPLGHLSDSELLSLRDLLVSALRAAAAGESD